MEKIKLSVIVPVYNVEKYLRECLESLMNQTLKEIEIICINDGSTDKSGEILNEFAKKDKRITVIGQQNGGLSCARNNGIEYAKGEYIGFVDADDKVEANFYERLYNSITKHEADIACADIITNWKYFKKYKIKYFEERIFSDLKDKTEICKVPKYCYVWNKLYKSELIKKHLFKEGVYYEDMFWLPEVLKDSDKLVTVPNTGYYYNSSKISVKNPKEIFKEQEQYKKAYEFINNFFEEHNIELNKTYKQINQIKINLFDFLRVKLKINQM